MLIVADFTQSQSEGFFERIMQQLEGKDISMLINNVGISNVGRLHEVAPQRLMNEINVNVVSMTMMTRYIVPLMLQR